MFRRDTTGPAAPTFLSLVTAFFVRGENMRNRFGEVFFEFARCTNQPPFYGDDAHHFAVVELQDIARAGHLREEHRKLCVEGFVFGAACQTDGVTAPFCLSEFEFCRDHGRDFQIVANIFGHCYLFLVGVMVRSRVGWGDRLAIVSFGSIAKGVVGDRK